MKQGDCGGFAVRDAGTAGEPRSSSAGREDGLRQEAQSSFRKMRFDGSLLQRRAVQRRRKKIRHCPLLVDLKLGLQASWCSGSTAQQRSHALGKPFFVYIGWKTSGSAPGGAHVSKWVWRSVCMWGGRERWPKIELKCLLQAPLTALPCKDCTGGQRTVTPSFTTLSKRFTSL